MTGRSASQPSSCFSLFFLLACAFLPLHTCSKPAPYTLSPHQIQTFKRDGVLVVRGLLADKDLKDAVRAAKRIQLCRTLSQRLLYRIFPSYQSLQFQTWRRHKSLERVAFDSAASTICAQLMGLDGPVNSKNNSDMNSSPRPVRLLKDAVLGYRNGDKGCGWHVDDKIFWPTEDGNVGKSDAGINVWITLSPVSAAEGGGLAVAPGTHKAQFAKNAREAIAAKGPMTTCILESLRPDCHQKMEKLKQVYDLQPGDAIIHDRYVFHRADAFVDPIQRKRANTKHRISLRYVPADATFYKFGDNERAVQEKDMVTGDELSKGGEYYPQVWPDSLPEERGKKVGADKRFMSLTKVLGIMLQSKKE
mmetsp:Transcript_37902/g.77342  ORF Transcript_37902/g.77342 Transcript_37902/m.77342 type:complete len:362 (-) Transcript_37902:142-1227(-)